MECDALFVFFIFSFDLIWEAIRYVTYAAYKTHAVGRERPITRPEDNAVARPISVV